MKLTEVFRPHSPQWEAKVTQYEGDFDRVSSTVRKEVVRFEVHTHFLMRR